MSITRTLHAGCLICFLIAVAAYLLFNISAALIFGVIGLIFEVAAYVLMYEAHRHRRAESRKVDFPTRRDRLKDEGNIR